MSHPCDTAHKATTAMHPAQSWRDGWDDAVQGQPHGATHLYEGHSALLYSDGYACGCVRRRAVLWVRNDEPAAL